MLNGFKPVHLRYLSCLPTSSLTNYDDSLEALHQVQDVVSVLNKKQQIKELNTQELNAAFWHTAAYMQACIEGVRDLENREFLPLFLYRESGVRVEDDGGSGGLCVELPLLRDPRSLGP